MYNNNGQKILCTIEARMSSSRLPGKVLLPLGGEPSLKRQIERIQKSKYVDQVVVATTVNQSDDLIVEMCESINCNYYRGSEEDVLSRVLEAARKNEADLMVESTGDCPWWIRYKLIDSLNFIIVRTTITSQTAESREVIRLVLI